MRRRTLTEQVFQAMKLKIACAMGVVLGCLVASWSVAQQTPPAEKPRAELTAAQKKQVQLLSAEFRKTKSIDARVEIIARAAQIDAVAVEPLAELVAKEIHKELTPYRQQFLRAAAATAGARVNPAAVAEVTQLRGKVLELSKREDLSKEMIVEVSDPALARLKEIALVDRTEVLKLNPELAKRRESVVSAGKLWEACARYLQTDDSGDAPTFESYLAKEEEIAAALAMPMDDRTRQVLAANAQLAPRLDPEEARCILDLNLTRNLLGLGPVAIDPALVAAARDHSADMEKHNFFSHTSPLPGKTSPGDRAKLFNTTYSGENIASGTIDGAAANRMWWHSPGHHKNMLGDHKRVGVGRSGRLWTEMFGG